MIYIKKDPYRTIGILVRVTPEQHKYIKKFVFERGISASEIFRRYIDYLRRKDVKTGRGLLHEQDETVELNEPSEFVPKRGQFVEISEHLEID